MRQVVWLLLLFAVAVLAASTLGANDGLVSIYWSPWRIDLSFNVFVILLLAVGAIAHVVTGAVASLIDLPQRARQWRLQQREQAAQKSLREAFSLLFAGRYGRAHKAAQQALDIQAQTPGLRIEPDFAVLAHLVAAGSLHRLQDQARRDEQLARAQALIADMPSGTTVGEGARIGAGARLSDCIIWPGVSVGAGARVTASVCGSGADVPAGATLAGEVTAGDVGRA